MNFKPKLPHHIIWIFCTLLFICFYIWIFLQGVEFLGDHSNHWTQVCNNLIAQLGFAECQRAKTPSIFHTTKDLYHGNLNQLEIFWKRIGKHYRCWKSLPKMCQWIHIKCLSHGITCIWFHGQFEQTLLNVKESRWQHFKGPYIITAQFLKVAKGNLNPF
jgi:hypothetical protein